MTMPRASPTGDEEVIHLPKFAPCKNGLFRLECRCGFRPKQRFTSLQGAERFWLMHVDEELSD